MPVGSYHHGGAEPDGLCMCGPMRKDREGVGGNGELDRVMLRCPCDFKATILRNLHELQGLGRHRAHVRCGIEALQTDRDRKSHFSSSPMRWPSLPMVEAEWSRQWPGSRGQARARREALNASCWHWDCRHGNQEWGLENGEWEMRNEE